MQTYFRLFPLLAIFAVLVLSGCLFSAPSIQSSAEPIEHDLWDELVQKYVDDNGMIDYQGMAQDSQQLNNYLDLLSKNGPDESSWTRNQQLAYWINAYNAFTVKLILDHYPVASIKDIKSGIPFVNTVWDIKFFKIAGEDFDLNNIEHGILRKMNEPRFHFAIVCASLSCPKLQPFAYTADRLDEQLNEAGREFFAEPFRNEFTDKEARLSKLLDWYWGDFKDKYANRIALVNAYRPNPLPATTPVTYLEYDWSINDQAKVDNSIFDE